MKKIKLAIVFGGKSSEYPVSLHSAASVLRNINNETYDVTYIGINQDGAWFVYDGDIDHIEHDTWQQPSLCTPCVLSCSQGHKGFLVLGEDNHFETLEVDCVFPVLHGKNGEDGTLQGLLELSDIPYVGCRHMSSAVCMDKEMSHIILECAGVPCAPYICVYEASALDYEGIYTNAVETLGLPLFIKPANAGSSFGISKITSFEHFEKGMKDAFYHDGKGKVILETTIEGFEIGCAVMGNQDVFVGSVDEIQTSLPFFDYEGKYQMVDSHIYCPARIPADVFEQARVMAKDAFRALNCTGMARVDMFVTPDLSIVLNEVNTIPGFTATSRYPSMMKEAGVSFPALIDRLVTLALTK